MSMLPNLDLADRLAKPPEETRWVIDRLIEAGTRTFIHSDAGVGKSLVALAMAVCVVRGIPFCGRQTRQGKVVYVDNENGEAEIIRRLRSMGLSPSDAGNLYFASYPGPVLGEGGDLLETVLEVRPELVVIDTLRSSFDGDESSDRETQQALGSLVDILVEGIPVILLGHDKKASGDGASTYRGSSNIKAQVETMYHLKRLPDNRRLLHIGPDDKTRSGLVDNKLEIIIHHHPGGTIELVDAAPPLRVAVRGALQRLGRPVSCGEIALTASRRKDDVLRELNAMVEQGEVEVEQQSGKRTKLYRLVANELLPTAGSYCK